VASKYAIKPGNIGVHHDVDVESRVFETNRRLPAFQH
jgi:hypothetical protein